MLDAKARRVVAARRDTLIFLLVVILLMLGALGLSASVSASLSALAFGLLTLAGLGITLALGKEIRHLNRDLNASPLTERCRLISSLTMPRFGDESWHVETPHGRQNMLNLTSLPGGTLQGKWLILTYTQHTQLVLHARADE